MEVRCELVAPPMSEFHNLAEIALNSDGSAWGNLGYWRDEDEYSDACRALAIVLGDALQLDKASIIMDAGFGCGDQISLWRDHYQVRHIHGVNHSHSQTAYAKQRLLNAGYDLDVGALRYGDIDRSENWKFWSKNQMPNRVLALDCAYHFSSRICFSEHAFRNLQPGGIVGVTDILLGDGYSSGAWNRLLLRWMLKLSRIAAANVVAEQTYVLELQRSGFNQIKLQDISQHVLPAFGDWFGRFERSSNGGPHALRWKDRLKYRMTARFLNWAYHRDILRYYVVTAVKPKPREK